jgi:hypothetical protein
MNSGVAIFLLLLLVGVIYQIGLWVSNSHLFFYISYYLGDFGINVILFYILIVVLLILIHKKRIKNIREKEAGESFWISPNSKTILRRTVTYTKTSKKNGVLIASIMFFLVFGIYNSFENSPISSDLSNVIGMNCKQAVSILENEYFSAKGCGRDDFTVLKQSLDPGKHLTYWKGLYATEVFLETNGDEVLNKEKVAKEKRKAEEEEKRRQEEEKRRQEEEIRRQKENERNNVRYICEQVGKSQPEYADFSLDWFGIGSGEPVEVGDHEYEYKAYVDVTNIWGTKFKNRVMDCRVKLNIDTRKWSLINFNVYPG